MGNFYEIVMLNSIQWLHTISKQIQFRQELHHHLVIAI